MEQVFFNVPLAKLEPIFKKWVKDVFQENNQKPQPPTPEPDDLKTRLEALGYLRVTSATLWRWEKQGKIQSIGIGGKRYFRKSDLDKSLILKK